MKIYLFCVENFLLPVIRLRITCASRIILGHNEKKRNFAIAICMMF